jgi:hypothetical protein
VRFRIAPEGHCRDTIPMAHEMNPCPRCKALDAELFRREQQTDAVVFHFVCRGCGARWMDATSVEPPKSNVVPFPAAETD